MFELQSRALACVACAVALALFSGCTLPEVFVTDPRDKADKDAAAEAPGGDSTQDGKSSSTKAAAKASDAGAQRMSGADAKRDAATKPSDDADSGVFFIDDPFPPMCGPNGAMTSAAAASGTEGCPSDKNREGCACSNVGEEAECWPGMRLNRDRGICHDGKTVCQRNADGRRVWGPCVGYALPKPGALKGADACTCFSTGKWALSNLVPCIVEAGSETYLYSSRPNGQGGYTCDSVSQTPPPAPSPNWSKSTLTVDCAGQFELCYTMKAGKATAPVATDCVLMRSCADIWYATAGSSQVLPELPGWTARDASCAARFKQVGGYGEMSVRGISTSCERVDDGANMPRVFERTTYCAPDCSTTPTAPDCADCAVMGSGDF